MSVRLHVPLPLIEGETLSLPAEAARHVQVLRLQPGDGVRLFDGRGAESPAEILRMGRQEVEVRLGAPLVPLANELPVEVLLAMGMPANERMDALVEKATELGARALQPLQCSRSVLKLTGERAERRVGHWQGVAVAAAEQSGRRWVPEVAPIQTLAAWLAALGPAQPDECRCLLSFADDAQPPAQRLAGARRVLTLSGPEGGLDPREEALARAAGFRPVSLGPRVLRADTAPLALLAWLGLSALG